MGQAAAPLSIAATGLSAGSKLAAGGTAAGNAITQGYSTQAADQYRAQQLADQAEYGQLAATQTATDMQLKLQNQLANVAVIQAAGNTDPNSPTNYAIANRTEAVGDMNRQQRVGNIQAQIDEETMASRVYSQAGAAALSQGYANANTDQMNGWLGALGAGMTGLAGLKFSGNTSLPNNSGGGLLGFNI